MQFCPMQQELKSVVWARSSGRRWKHLPSSFHVSSAEAIAIRILTFVSPSKILFLSWLSFMFVFYRYENTFPRLVFMRQCPGRLTAKKKCLISRIPFKSFFLCVCFHGEVTQSVCVTCIFFPSQNFDFIVFLNLTIFFKKFVR